MELSGTIKSIFTKKDDAISIPERVLEESLINEVQTKISIYPESESPPQFNVQIEVQELDESVFQVEQSPENKKSIDFSHENNRNVYKKNYSYFDQEDILGPPKLKKFQTFDECKNFQSFDHIRTSTRTKSFSPNSSSHGNYSMEGKAHSNEMLFSSSSLRLNVEDDTRKKKTSFHTEMLVERFEKMEEVKLITKEIYGLSDLQTKHKEKEKSIRELTSIYGQRYITKPY